MGGYAGSPQFQYWISLTGNNSAASISMISENVPVVAGSTVSMLFSAATTYASSSGFNLVIDWYSATGTSTGTSSTLSQANTTADEIYTLTGSGWTVPANTVYGVIHVSLTGTPTATDLLNIYQVVLQDSNGYILNQNAYFYYTSFPWALNTGGNLQWNYDKILIGDYDSLVIADIIECLGGPAGVPCPIPELLDENGVGPAFRILAPPTLNSTGYGYETSYDLNAPQPTQDVVASMLLDGERPFGYRASNRTITLPMLINGTNAGGMGQVLKAQEFLMQLTDQQVFTTKWTPADTGLPMIFDCFRALPSTQFYGFNYNQGNTNDETIGRTNIPQGAMTIQFQALPYGRSDVDGIQSLSFASPLINGQTAQSSVAIDMFPSANFNPFGDPDWNEDATTAVPNFVGHSAKFTPPTKKPYPLATYKAQVVGSGSSATTVNLSDCQSIQFYVGLAYNAQWPADSTWKCNINFRCTLWDSNGNSVNFSKTVNKMPFGPASHAPTWSQVAVPLPVSSTFDYGSVYQYQIQMSNWAGSGTTGFIRCDLWLNALEGVPWTIANTNSPRGVSYNLFGLPGTARAPINVIGQLPAAAPTTQEFTSAGLSSWTVPDYVYSLEAECIGGGGAGSSVNTILSGGGGGGGEYAAETNLLVSPGAIVPLSVGAGGTPAQLNPTVVVFKTAGLNHWTCPSGVTTAAVECWGGGGAGAAGGGGGGGGKYEQAETVTVTPGTTYYINVGAGGKANTGKTAADNAGRDGQNSWFNTTNTEPVSGVNPGMPVGQGGYSPLTGSSSGGTRGGGGSPVTANVIRNDGGYGGTSPGAAGGGGGASGAPSGAGNAGQASPPTLNYTTGGAGAAGGTDRGAGGNGANAPGVPGAGQAPGGGGGGGYTGGANYIGANGGTGQVRLTYSVGNGAVINGTSTVFGSATTTFVNGTGTTVTAHGATSIGPNVSTASAGASGSTNTVHFSGGAGFPDSTVTPSYGLVSDVSTVFQNMGSVTWASPTVTGNITATAALATGCSIAIVTLSANNPDVTVSDSAGNTYALATSSTASNGTTIMVFYGNPVFPVTTSTVLTTSIGTGTIPADVSVLWIGSKFLWQPVSGNTGINNGSGTSASVTAGTASAGTPQVELAICANNTASATITASSPGVWFGAAPTDFVGIGNLQTAAFTSIGQGGTADVASFSLAETAPWAAVLVPMALSQSSIAAGRLGTAAASAATSATVTLTKGVQPGGGIVLVEVRQATSGVAVSTIADTAGNTYVLVKNGSIGGTNRTDYYAAVSNGVGLVPGNTIVTTFVSSATAGITVYFFPGAIGTDSASVATASGTSTAPALTIPAQSAPNELMFISFTNGSSLNVTGVSAPNLVIGNATSGTAYTNDYMRQQVGTSSFTVTGTLSASAAWITYGFGIIYGSPGGGGGAAGGPMGAGWNAIGYLGAPGITGGGKGGNGAQTANASGTAAAIPGGGGGGASATTVPAAGSALIGGGGGAGLVRLTWQPPLKPFNNIIIHRPGQGASPYLSPVQQIPITDTPSNIEYPVQSLTSQSGNAIFNSTYTVLLINNSWDTPANARNVTVTVNQYEYVNGPAYTVQCTRTLTPYTDVVNGLVTMGELTLPIKVIPPGNDTAYFTFSIHDTDQSDTFMDILFLDTTGQTVIVNIPAGSPADSQYVNYFMDEPTPDMDLGIIAGTYQNRKSSVGVLDYSLISGGPLYVDPGDNLLVAYSVSGAPNIGVTYAPRWYNSRTQ